MCAEEAQDAAAGVTHQATQCWNQHPGIWNPKLCPWAAGQWGYLTQQQTCWIGEVADECNAHADKDIHRSPAQSPWCCTRTESNSAHP